MAEPLDLAGPLRLAIIGNAAVTALLGVWNGEPAVFTRRPVPADAPYPMIVVSEDISIGDVDFLTTRIPMPRRDIIVYGQQPDNYRDVESAAYLIRQQFHRERFSVDVSPGYSVVDIRAVGPMPAPVDDQNIVGRAVMLTLKLRDLAT